MKMQKMQTTLKTRESQWPHKIKDVQIVAYTTEAPGLVVARLQRGWAIIHQNSGYPLHSPRYNLRTMRLTLKVASDLAGIADWTLAADELNRIDNLPRQVAEAFERVML